MRQALAPEGLVFLHGEIWRARSADGEAIPVGAPIKVEALREGLVLEVSPLEQPVTVADGETG